MKTCTAIVKAIVIIVHSHDSILHTIPCLRSRCSVSLVLILIVTVGTSVFIFFLLILAFTRHKTLLLGFNIVFLFIRSRLLIDRVQKQGQYISFFYRLITTKCCSNIAMEVALNFIEKH